MMDRCCICKNSGNPSIIFCSIAELLENCGTSILSFRDKVGNDAQLGGEVIG